MKRVNIPSRNVLVMLVLSLVIFMTTSSMGDDFRNTEKKVVNGQQHTNEQKWTKFSVVGTHRYYEIPLHYKNVHGFDENLSATPFRRAAKRMKFAHTDNKRSREIFGKYTFKLLCSH